MTERTVLLGGKKFQGVERQGPELAFLGPGAGSPERIDPEPGLELWARQGWGRVDLKDVDESELVGRRVDVGGRLFFVTNQIILGLEPTVNPESLRTTFGLSYLERLAFGDNLFVARVPASIGAGLEVDELTARLASTEGVTFAEADLVATVQGSGLSTFGVGAAPTNTATASIFQPWQWGVSGVNTESLLDQAVAGQGVTVGVIDLGFDGTHPSLDVASSSRVTSKAEVLPGGWSQFDYRHHGTFCAGLSTAAAGPSGKGAAPAARVALVGLDLLSQATLGAALHRCAEAGARVVSASLASCTASVPGECQGTAWVSVGTALEDSLQGLRQAHGGRGVNTFWATANYPGDVADNAVCAHPDVIAVGPLTPSNDRGSGETGEELEFLAPGEAVGSTIPGGGFATAPSGASWATPHAAGVAALLLSKHSSASADQVRAAMASGCRPVAGEAGAGTHHDDYGFGAIDAELSLFALSGALGP